MSEFQKNFSNIIPDLCKHTSIRNEIKNNGTHEEISALAQIDKEIITQDNLDSLYGIVSDHYSISAKVVFSLGWDGCAPGSAGATWIKELGGVYITTSSDYEPSGPYSTLAKALKYESFNIVTPNPELHSDVLSKNELLEIAKNVVDEDGVIFINGEECHVDFAEENTGIAQEDVDDESHQLADSNEDLVFEDEITKILGGSTGIGSFKQQVTMDDGEVREYSFSFAVGQGRLYAEFRYKSTFAKPLPHWVKLQHPYHIALLAKLAMRFETPLPDEFRI